MKIVMHTTAAALFLALSLNEANAEIAPTEPVVYEQSGCYGFFGLEFNIFNYAGYETYFTDDSVMTLAQTGSYKGRDNIEEYVRFADSTSPYINEQNVVEQVVEMEGESPVIADFNPSTGVCKFNINVLVNMTMNDELTDGGYFEYGYLVNVYYSIGTNNLPRVDIYYTPEFLVEFFGRLTTNEVDEFVCDVLTGPPCAGTDVPEKNGYFPSKSGKKSTRKCNRELSNLPDYTGDVYSDGNTQACRMLHAVFAENNPDHCPHVSLAEVADKNGDFKCQVSEDIQVSDLFSTDEINKLEDVCIGSSKIGNDSCFNVVETKLPSKGKKTKKAKKTKQPSGKK